MVGRRLGFASRGKASMHLGIFEMLFSVYSQGFSHIM
jgi:hypothetical protein